MLLVDSVLDGAPASSVDGVPDARDAPPAWAGIDPAVVPADLLRDAAHLHRVTPAVYRHLASAPDAPVAWLETLRGDAKTQVMRHLLAMADLAAVRGVLAGTGCAWAAVKGPVAAECVWPASMMREYYDVDIVVEHRHFADVLDALLGAGFVQVDRNWPLLLGTRRAEIELRGPQGTAVDLHWDIAVPPRLRSAFATNVPAMLARTVPVSVGALHGVPTLDPVDTAVHLTFHAAQGGANRLMWIADVRFAVGRPGFDWELFAQRVRRMRFEVPAALVLARVGRTLGFAEAPPPSVLAPAGGAWGRAARVRDRYVPFPGLPGDEHLGGSLYVCARNSVGASLLQAARYLVEIRESARTGPGAPPLHADVPDPAARRQYLAAVTRGDRP